ncbi:MAG: ABC transporter permease [Christensenellaceae bacterium]|jgi:ABC-type antimicrobial peptide transport system permease subunit|nr:ABC transporter permease [Christensenellaceae bacterium]
MGGTKIDILKYQVSASNAVALSIFSDNDITKINIIKENPAIRYLAPYTVPLKFHFTSKSLFQTNGKTSDSIEMYAKPLPTDFITIDQIIFGTMSNSMFDVVIDKLYIDSIFTKSEEQIEKTSIFGITTIKGVLGCKLLIGDCVMNIVGISDTKTPTIYIHRDLIAALSLQMENITDMLILSSSEVNHIQSDVTLINDNEILISKKRYEEYGFVDGSENTLIINEKTYSVIGWFLCNDNAMPQSVCIVKESEQNNIVLQRLAASHYAEAIVNGEVNTIIEKLKENGIYAQSLIKIERDNYISKYNSQMTLQLVFTLIIGSSTILCYYFSVKASIVDKKKELAVKIALGIRRISILGQFLLNALLFFMIFAMPIYLISQLFISLILNSAPSLFAMMNFTFANFFMGFIILLSIPVVVTIIPLFKYLYERPAKLLRDVL